MLEANDDGSFLPEGALTMFTRLVTQIDRLLGFHWNAIRVPSLG